MVKPYPKDETNKALNSGTKATEFKICQKIYFLMSKSERAQDARKDSLRAFY
jgi:hypothetical protein